MRGTVIARIYKDHWTWTHWHGSMREPPAAPAAAQPMAAQSAAPAATAPQASASAPAP